MKIQPKEKQHKEYRGLVATNEKGDLTKKRMINKFSDKNGKPVWYCSHDIRKKRVPVV